MQDFGLVLGGRPNAELIRYLDADWGQDHDTRRSRTGYAFMLGVGAVTWKSKLQSTVALSTCEAEYMALTHATKEAIWLQSLLAGLGHPQGTVTIREDNQGTIATAENPSNHSRMKHVSIRYHFVRDKVAEKAIRIEYLPTDDNVADVMTKALACDKFDKFRALLGVQQRKPAELG